MSLSRCTGPSAFALVVGLLLATLPACAPARPAPPSGAAAAAPAAPTAPPVTAERISLTVPSKALAYLVYYLGREQGFYEAEGIQLDVQPVQARLGVAALASGELAYTAAIGASIDAAAAGQPLRAVLFVLRDVVWGLVAALEITSVAELRGKTVAVTNPAQLDTFALHAVLRAHGVAPEEVSPPSSQDAGSRFAALTSGALPAAVLPLPFDQQAEHMGFRELAWMADYFHRAQSDLITTPSHLQQQPDQVRRMIRATLRGVRYALDHEAETVAYVTQEFDVNPALAQSTYAKIARGLSVNGDVDPSVVQQEIDADLARIGREPGMQASEIIDLTLLREVQQDLGTH